MSFLLNIVNNFPKYFFAFGIFLSCWIFLQVFSLLIVHFVKKKTKQTKIHLIQGIVRTIRRGSWFPSIIVSIYVSCKTVSLFPTMDGIISRIFVSLLSIYVAWFIGRIASHISNQAPTNRQERKRHTSIAFFWKLIQIVAWVGVILYILPVWGYNTSVFLTSLGISGLVITFAVRNTLSQLFSSLIIFLNRPFEKGEFIAIGEDQGRVEKIGFRTTCIRAPQGEDIIIPNYLLTSKILRNYSDKKKIQMILPFALDYGSEADDVNKVAVIATEVMEEIDLAENSQVNFKKFGQSGMVFNLVYDLMTTDYDLIQRVHHQTSLTFWKRTKEKGIELKPAD